MNIIKGMVHVQGTTYRIVRLEVGRYQVIRIHDEAVVGGFSCGRLLSITALLVDGELMRTIASSAVQLGRTSFVGRPRLTESQP